MPDAALYYPYINVPSAPSLTRVLLYWDRLGAIVPRDANVELSDDMRALIAAGLVEAIEPEAYLDSLDGFEDTFVDHRSDASHRASLRHGIHSSCPASLPPPWPQRLQI